MSRVRDYISRCDIWGLWLYSQEVDWAWDKFVDDDPQPDLHNKPLKLVHVHDWLARHSYRPTPIQAFHYGHHKVGQKHQHTTLRNMLDHFGLTRAPAVYYACLGSLAAFDEWAEKGKPTTLSYGLPLELVFDRMMDQKITDRQLCQRLNARLMEYM